MPTTAALVIPLLAQADAAPAASGGKTLLSHLLASGPVGLIIVLLSVAAASLVVAHFVNIRLARLAPQDVFDGIRDALVRRDLAGAAAFSDRPDNACFLARVLSTAVHRSARSPFGTLEFRTAVEQAGQDEVARLYRATDGLALIAAVAPMLGLFGTVIGIVGAFDSLGASAGGIAKPDQLAGSISVALNTTAMGLAVAIPATAFVTFFRNRIDSIASRIARMTEDLLATVESQAPQPGRAAPAPRPGASSASVSPSGGGRAAPQPPRPAAPAQA
ncbi:MAG: MotA/TolQ/ExbB proton channel family protein [Planctomycetota bacterium]